MHEGRISLLMTILDEGCSENGRGECSVCFRHRPARVQQDDDVSLFGVVAQHFKFERVSTKLDPFRSDSVKDNVFVKKNAVRRRVVFL
jgi:hypothetical protein